MMIHKQCILSNGEMEASEFLVHIQVLEHILEKIVAREIDIACIKTARVAKVEHLNPGLAIIIVFIAGFPEDGDLKFLQDAAHEYLIDYLKANSTGNY